MRTQSRRIGLTVAASIGFIAVGAYFLTNHHRKGSIQPGEPFDRPRVAGAQKGFSEVELALTLPEGGERLDYSFGWNGIPSASFRVEVSREARNAQGRTVLAFCGQTLSAIDWAWSYRTSGAVYIEPETLLPCFSSRMSVKGEKTKSIFTRFDRLNGLARTVTEKLYKGTRSTSVTRFSQGLDIPSAFLYVRTFDWRVNHTRRIEVVDKRDVYVVELTPIGPERVQVGAGTFDAVEVDLKVRPLSEEPREESERKYTKVRVWFSTDENRLPVLLRSEVFVGYVYAELVRRNY